MGISEDTKVILYVGRMEEEKGIYDLAQAAEKLTQRGEEMTFIYIEGGGRNQEIEKRIKRQAPNASLHFSDPISREERERLAAMYTMADAVVQPTWGECFNQIVAEGLALGTPAVVSDFSGPGEIYVGNGAAVGCKVNDPQDLANQISLLINDQETHRRVSEQGQQLVERELNSTAMAQRYMGIYEELMN
jgi:hypothetical protein